MMKTLLALAVLLLASPALAFDSIDLTYGPTGAACDSQWHEVEWTNPGPSAVTVSKVILSGVGTPQITGQPLSMTGVWYSEVRVESATGGYKTIALAMEELTKASAATVADYPDGLVVVQPGESLVHKTYCGATAFYYAWAYVLVK